MSESVFFLINDAEYGMIYERTNMCRHVIDHFYF